MQRPILQTCTFRTMKMMSSSYLWWTTPQNVRLPSLLCIFLGKMGKPNSALSKSHQTFFQAHDQKNPCPAGDGQCLGEHPSEHQQNCSSPTQPTSMVGLVKSLKTKGKSALAQKLLRNVHVFFCSSLVSPLLSILMRQVYASGSAIK